MEAEADAHHSSHRQCSHMKSPYSSHHPLPSHLQRTGMWLKHSVGSSALGLVFWCLASCGQASQFDTFMTVPKMKADTLQRSGKTLHKRGLEFLRRAVLAKPKHPKSSRRKRKRTLSFQQRPSRRNASRKAGRAHRHDTNYSNSSARSRSRSRESRSYSASRSPRQRSNATLLRADHRPSSSRPDLQPSARFDSQHVRYLESPMQEDRAMTYVMAGEGIWNGRPMKQWLAEFHQEFKKLATNYGSTVAQAYLYHVHSFWPDIQIRDSSLTHFNKLESPEVQHYMDRYIKKAIEGQAFTPKEKAVKSHVINHPLTRGFPPKPYEITPPYPHPNPTSTSESNASPPNTEPAHCLPPSNLYHGMSIPMAKTSTVKHVASSVAASIKSAASAISWRNKAPSSSATVPPGIPQNETSLPRHQLTLARMKSPDLYSSQPNPYNSFDSEEDSDDYGNEEGAPARFEASQHVENNQPSKLWSAMTYVGAIGGALKGTAASSGTYLASKTSQYIGSLYEKCNRTASLSNSPLSINDHSSSRTMPPLVSEEMYYTRPFPPTPDDCTVPKKAANRWNIWTRLKGPPKAQDYRQSPTAPVYGGGKVASRTGVSVGKVDPENVVLASWQAKARENAAKAKFASTQSPSASSHNNYKNSSIPPSPSSALSKSSQVPTNAMTLAEIDAHVAARSKARRQLENLNAPVTFAKKLPKHPISMSDSSENNEIPPRSYNPNSQKYNSSGSAKVPYLSSVNMTLDEVYAHVDSSILSAQERKLNAPVTSAPKQPKTPLKRLDPSKQEEVLPRSYNPNSQKHNSSGSAKVPYLSSVNMTLDEVYAHVDSSILSAQKERKLGAPVISAPKQPKAPLKRLDPSKQKEGLPRLYNPKSKKT